MRGVRLISAGHWHEASLALPATVAQNATTMKTVPIEVKGGVLRLPAKTRLPSRARLAVLVMDDEKIGDDLRTLVAGGRAFDFLHAEPDIYSDADVLPKRRNPRFGRAS